MAVIKQFSEDHVLLSHEVPEVQTQVASFGDRCLYSLSYIANPSQIILNGGEQGRIGEVSRGVRLKGGEEGELWPCRGTDTGVQKVASGPQEGFPKGG